MNYLRLNNLTLKQGEGLTKKGHERQIMVHDDYVQDSDEEVPVGESDIEFEDQLEKFK